MRIWSIHPKYLDTKGLLAAWREALLAQKVLQGKTIGYKNHPQLLRFKSSKDPMAAIGFYLLKLLEEASRRNYQFDGTKILNREFGSRLPVNQGQVEFEWIHFKHKVKQRDPNNYFKIRGVKFPDLHPLFRVKKGEKEDWEKG